MELWRNKLTNTLVHLDLFTVKKNCNYAATSIDDKQTRHITKYLLLFQYKTTINAFNIKTKSFQVQYISHARIRRY